MATTSRPNGPRGQSQQPQQQARPKILRIGVILGDKIVEERLIRDRDAVTIGQSAKNTFAVPASELPKSWSLFQLINGRYVLNVADSMDGRISDGGQVMTMAQLKATGKATKQGAAWQIPLSDNARGKVNLADMTLLFQFVAAPPLQPRPMLPHSVRGSLGDRIDPYMAVILVASIVAHSSLWGYLKYAHDAALPPPPDVIPAEFQAELRDLPRSLQPKKIENTGAAVAAEEDKDKTKTEEKPKTEDKTAENDKPVDKPGSPDKAAVEEKVNQAAPIWVLDQLASKGGEDSSGGPLVSSSKKSFSVDDDVSNAAKSGDPLAVNSERTTRGPGGTELASQSGNPTTTGPRDTGPTTIPKKEVEVKGAASAEKLEDLDAGGLDPGKVATTINGRYKTGVIKCYQTELKRNPTLAGKVNIAFTVGMTGKVIKAKASGFPDANVERCIEDYARTWRFDKPESDASFEIPFVLRKA
jgi:hypothetical protein